MDYPPRNPRKASTSYPKQAQKKDGTLMSRKKNLFTKEVTVMTLSYYAARANLSHLLQLHPDWSQAELAAALGYSKEWIKKWRKRLREELVNKVKSEQVLGRRVSNRREA